MTSPTRTLAENVEKLEEEYDRDAQLLFVGADPQKAMGWQPVSEMPATPRMEDDEEMPEMEDRPDTSYDYDAELYRDGES
uniref:Reverse transcriptase-rnase h-integrase n=1 Tax=Moniliophthora roreri TaxID=221103 RepID=A0A0W0FG52_MONRR